LKADWEKNKKDYIKLAARIVRRAEKRGFKVDVTGGPE
jgi:hypothetical protein